MKEFTNTFDTPEKRQEAIIAFGDKEFSKGFFKQVGIHKGKNHNIIKNFIKEWRNSILNPEPTLCAEDILNELFKNLNQKRSHKDFINTWEAELSKQESIQQKEQDEEPPSHWQFERKLTSLKPALQPQFQEEQSESSLDQLRKQRKKPDSDQWINLLQKEKESTVIDQQRVEGEAPERNSENLVSLLSNYGKLARIQQQANVEPIPKDILDKNENNYKSEANEFIKKYYQ